MTRTEDTTDAATGARYGPWLEFEFALSDLDGALACVELMARLLANDPEETTPDEAAALVFAVKGARAAAALDRFYLHLPATELREAGHG